MLDYRDSLDKARPKAHDTGTLFYMRIEVMKLDFFEILVIILLVAKITGYADIGWWVVAVPYLIGIVVHTLGGWVAERKMKRVVRRF